MLSDFRERAMVSLTAAKPVIAQLLFTNPSFSHAILITGTENQISPNGSLMLRVFDPMTGKQSIATLNPGIGKIGDLNFEGLSFSDSDIVSQNGFMTNHLRDSEAPPPQSCSL